MVKEGIKNERTVVSETAKRFVKSDKFSMILSAVILVFSLSCIVFGQNLDPKSIMDPTPSKTDYFTPDQLKIRMGGVPGSTQTSGENLPFQVDSSYPKFYVIPELRRSPILDQGNCRSCVAYATSSALYTLFSDHFAPKGRIVPGLMVDPHLFFIFAGRMCLPGLPNSAWSTAGGVEHMSKIGSSMSLMDSGENSVGGTKTETLKGYYVKAGKYGSTTNVDAMRSFISRHGAMTADMMVYPAFNKYKTGIYNQDKFVNTILDALDDEIAKSTVGKEDLILAREAVRKGLPNPIGGHVVTVIGYFTGGKVKAQTVGSVFFPADSRLLKLMGDVEWDLPAFWIVQNSWGKEWGMNGIFFIEAGNPKPRNPCPEKYGCSWESIDDTMYYMMDPVVTLDGKRMN